MLLPATKNEHRTALSENYFSATTSPVFKYRAHPTPLRGPSPSREDLRSGSSGAKYKFAHEPAYWWNSTL